MPKVIFNNFSGGLSDMDRNIPNNMFAVGDGVDIHSLPGYILPGLAASDVTYSGASPQIIDYTILDTALDLVNNKAYHIGDGKLYQETTIGGGAFNSNFDGSSHYYKAIGSSNWSYFGELGVVMYKTNDVPMLFYIYGLASTGNIGRFDLASTFNDTFMSGTAAGGATLQKAHHPYLIWQDFFWVGNGRYLAKYDGTAAGGANGTMYPTQLDLGAGWEITGLFPTSNYVGIIARRAPAAEGGNNFTDNRIIFYDGASATYTYFTPLSENFSEGIVNFNGRILFAGNGRNPSSQLMQLTNDGNDVLAYLRIFVNGTQTNFGSSFPHGIVTLRDRIMFIAGNGGIFSYGRNKVSEQNALSFPYILTLAAGCQARYLKQINNTVFYASYSDNSGANGYHLAKIDLASNVYNTARYKSGYIDFGQKVKINYIKFYYKTLASGDSITPTLDLDYGTSVTLKDPRGNTTISYTNDFRNVTDINNSNTSKRFNVDLSCHSFRPCLSWTGGGTAFSKIVIDYTFVEDN